MEIKRNEHKLTKSTKSSLFKYIPELKKTDKGMNKNWFPVYGAGYQSRKGQKDAIL